jgi:glycosyltransferase involved in cell wall biosynthesis
VSVIIPTYNRADYVVEALRSARAQTYPRKQIIVVDDGSRDDTARRVAEFEGVEYLYQENRGQGAARNRGLRSARGEFIASLDSDDLWDEDFLARGVECLEAFGLDFAFANWTKLRGGETPASGCATASGGRTRGAARASGTSSTRPRSENFFSKSALPPPLLWSYAAARWLRGGGSRCR